MSLSPDARPRLLRGVRLHHDRVRDAWVLLAPERALRLDPIGLAILQELDGSSLGEICARLAARFDAPEARVAQDAGAFLDGLRARRMIDA